MEEFDTDVGKRIKYLRKAANLTQEQLAQGIGVKRSVISKYENGTIEPSFTQVKRIADFLNVSWYKLMGAADEWDGRKIIYEKNPGVCFVEDNGRVDLVPAWIMEKIIDMLHAAAPIAPLQSVFKRLNEKGQDVALEKLKELAKNPEYTREETPPQSGEGQEAKEGQ